MFQLQIEDCEFIDTFISLKARTCTSVRVLGDPQSLGLVCPNLLKRLESFYLGLIVDSGNFKN